MSKGCKAFTRGKDQLGKQVQFIYRGGAKYGTMLGGICSIIVRCIIFILAGLEIYTTFNTPLLKETHSFS